SARSRASPRTMAKPIPTVHPVTNARLPRSFKSLTAFTLKVKSSSRVEPGKARVEIGLQILDVLETDMQAKCRSFRLPCGGGAVVLWVERKDQALETAPGIAHTEQAEAIEHRGNSLV